MSKVEELRDIIDAINDQCEKDLPYQTGLMFDVDSLIAAATAEGFVEGVEDTTANLTLVQDAEVFARGREEGAEQERERIRKAADHYQAEDECFAAQLVDGNYVGASYEMYVVSPSLLAPAPKEEGK